MCYISYRPTSYAVCRLYLTYNVLSSKRFCFVYRFPVFCTLCQLLTGFMLTRFSLIVFCLFSVTSNDQILIIINNNLDSSTGRVLLKSSGPMWFCPVQSSSAVVGELYTNLFYGVSSSIIPKNSHLFFFSNAIKNSAIVSYYG